MTRSPFTVDDAVVASNRVRLTPLVNVDVPLPCTMRLPVVVAPPKMVRPPACVPDPMVDEARERSPPVNVCSDDQVFDVVVPKPKDMLLPDSMTGYVDVMGD